MHAFYRINIFCKSYISCRPLQFESIYLDNICRHAIRGIVLSWALPGQVKCLEGTCDFILQTRAMHHVWYMLLLGG